MKWLIFILVILSGFRSSAQQTVRTCPEDRKTFTYYSFANGIGAWAWVMNSDTISHTNTITITWSDPGIYELVVYFESGCPVIPQYYKVEVLECVESAIYFPNAFTPNNDYTNDLYGPKGIGIKELHWSIWDRWGEMIFESDYLDIRPENCILWDGTNQKATGQYYCQNDIYVWKAEWTDVNNNRGSGVGFVALIR